MNHWKITKDYIEDGEDNGTVDNDWPCDPGSKVVTPVRFRLYDDDGNLYYQGQMEKVGFEPLDNFGRGAGCTELRYQEKGKWHQL